MGRRSNQTWGNRRTFLRASSLATFTSLAGCGQTDLLGPPTESNSGACPDLSAPNAPEVTPGSDQFYQQLVNIVRTLRTPWEKTAEESISDIATQTAEEAVNLLLPGIRGEVLPEAADSILSLIEATTYSFDVVAQANGILAKEEMRAVDEELNSPKVAEGYQAIERPLEERPEPVIDIPTVELPRRQPFCTLANILIKCLKHRLYDRLSAENARRDAEVIERLLTVNLLPHLKRKQYALEQNEEVILTNCSVDPDFTDDARIAALIYNLELLGVCAQTVVNMIEMEQATEEADSEQDSSKARPIENPFEWIVDPAPLLEEELVADRTGGANILILHPRQISTALPGEVTNHRALYIAPAGTPWIGFSNQTHQDVLTSIRDGNGVNYIAFDADESELIRDLEANEFASTTRHINARGWNLFEGNNLYYNTYISEWNALIAVKRNKVVIVPKYEDHSLEFIRTVINQEQVMELALATIEGERPGFIEANNLAGRTLRKFRDYRHNPEKPAIAEFVGNSQVYEFTIEVLRESDLDARQENSPREEQEIGAIDFLWYGDSRREVIGMPIMGDGTFNDSELIRDTVELSDGYQQNP